MDFVAAGWFHCQVSSLIVHTNDSIENADFATNIMNTSFYVTARLSVGFLNLVAAFIFPDLRFFHLWNVIICCVPTAFWIAALFVDYPENLFLKLSSFLLGTSFFIPLIIDWFPYYILYLVTTCYAKLKHKSDYIHRPLSHLMEFYPAVDMDSRIERTGNFITMVLGYIVVNLLYQSAARFGLNA
jgi:hypothetical protein